MVQNDKQLYEQYLLRLRTSMLRVQESTDNPASM